MFVVYRRSMCTYTDEYVKDEIKNLVKYDSDLNIYDDIAYFKKKEKAKKWLLKYGKSLTESFWDIFNQGCAFVILERHNLKKSEDDDDSAILKNLAFLNMQFPHYFFSKESYQMGLSEHARYVSNNWAENFPAWIRYVHKNGKITIGSNVKFLKKIQNLRHYRENHDAITKEEVDILKKYLKDGNPEVLKEIGSMDDYDF